MPTKINLSDYYQKYPKKIVDRIFKKFIELNSEESNMYNERFDKILELKNKNPYLSGREYHRLLYGDKFEEIWNNKNKNIITPYKQEYWLNKGYSRKESIEMISNYKKNKSTSLDNFILKYGEIEGKVLPEGIKAKVTISNGQGEPKIGNPDKKGRFRVRGLKEGTYSVLFEAPGKTSKTVNNIVVKKGKDVE